MRTVDIIVMGKTGAGKSTLINAILEEDLAPTGTGQPITRENKIYKKEMMIPTYKCHGGNYGLLSCTLSMYDTVGLEIDQTITEQTLEEIRQHMIDAKTNLHSEDILMVWFCVNEITKRFEPYEIELIKKLSIDYEIPFVIVLTQCISEKKGNLEKQIEEALPDVPLAKVLAKDYPIDDGVSIPARGIEDLLSKSFNDYQSRKIKLLETKIYLLDLERREQIKKIESKGNICIKRHSSSAAKIGFLPVISIPIVHVICIKMVAELNEIVGIKGDKNLATDIFVNTIVGIIATPFLAIPIFNITVAKAYIETIGESYLKVLLDVIVHSSVRDLKNNELMSKRIKEELAKLKK